MTRPDDKFMVNGCNFKILSGCQSPVIVQDRHRLVEDREEKSTGSHFVHHLPSRFVYEISQ